MIDPYITTLMTVGGTILGVLVGSLIQWQYRKKELDRIETFQAKLSEENQNLQEAHHDAEMQKITQVGQILYDMSLSLRKKEDNTPERPR